MADEKKPWKPRQPAKEVREKQDRDYGEERLLEDLAKVAERDAKPGLDDRSS